MPSTSEGVAEPDRVAPEGNLEVNQICRCGYGSGDVAGAVKERAVAVALARFVSTVGLVISRLALAALLQLF